MKYSLLEKLDQATITRIIADGWELETHRDIDGAIENFALLWSNIDEDPDFSEFELIEQANLYRLSGHFLGYYGKTRNFKFYQERGKNLICRAIDIFTRLEEKYSVAESHNALALCYYYEGAAIEAETILEQSAEEFLNDHLHLIYLKNRNNLLLTKFAQRKYDEALEIIEEIEVPIEFCEDKRICAVFHEKAGLIYRGVKEYDKAVWHYQEAIRYATEINNWLFIGTFKNNLAFLYYKIRNFELANFYIKEAILIAQEYNQIGWIPTYLDTQAMIYAGEGRVGLALETIEEAIKITGESDDAKTLTDALWNKCQFLLHLNRKEDAILLFNEMIPIAAVQMGEFAVTGFVKEFANLMHIKQGGSLDEEVKRFKRTEIVNAILEAKYNLHEAAESLKMNPTLLVKTLDKEFPELYDELDLLRPHQSAQNFEIVETKLSAPRNINELRMDSSKFVFENEAPLKFKTFYFSAEKMSEAFGIESDAVVTILPIDKITAGEFTLIEDLSRNLYSFGKVNYDKGLDLYFLTEKDEPTLFSTDEFRLIGKAFAFCPFDEIDEEVLHFRSLNL